VANEIVGLNREYVGTKEAIQHLLFLYDIPVPAQDGSGSNLVPTPSSGLSAEEKTMLDSLDATWTPKLDAGTAAFERYQFNDYARIEGSVFVDQVRAYYAIRKDKYLGWYDLKFGDMYLHWGQSVNAV
jgi:hypothetical protein